MGKRLGLNTQDRFILSRKKKREKEQMRRVFESIKQYFNIG